MLFLKPFLIVLEYEAKVFEGQVEKLNRSRFQTLYSMVQKILILLNERHEQIKTDLENSQLKSEILKAKQQEATFGGRLRNFGRRLSNWMKMFALKLIELLRYFPEFGLKWFSQNKYQVAVQKQKYMIKLVDFEKSQEKEKYKEHLDGYHLRRKEIESENRFETFHSMRKFLLLDVLRSKNKDDLKAEKLSSDRASPVFWIAQIEKTMSRGISSKKLIEGEVYDLGQLYRSYLLFQLPELEKIRKFFKEANFKIDECENIEQELSEKLIIYVKFSRTKFSKKATSRSPSKAKSLASSRSRRSLSPSINDNPSSPEGESKKEDIGEPLETKRNLIDKENEAGEGEGKNKEPIEIMRRSSSIRRRERGRSIRGTVTDRVQEEAGQEEGKDKGKEQGDFTTLDFINIIIYSIVYRYHSAVVLAKAQANLQNAEARSSTRRDSISKGELMATTMPGAVAGSEESIDPVANLLYAECITYLTESNLTMLRSFWYSERIERRVRVWTSQDNIKFDHFKKAILLRSLGVSYFNNHRIIRFSDYQSLFMYLNLLPLASSTKGVRVDISIKEENALMNKMFRRSTYPDTAHEDNFEKVIDSAEFASLSGSVERPDSKRTLEMITKVLGVDLFIQLNTSNWQEGAKMDFLKSKTTLTSDHPIISRIEGLLYWLSLSPQEKSLIFLNLERPEEHEFFVGTAVNVHSPSCSSSRSV